MGYDVTVGAMSAFVSGVSVTAHNVANVNTRDFQSWSRTYSSNPGTGGVQAVVEPGTALRTVLGTQTGGDTVSLLNEEVLDGSPGSNNVDIGREFARLSMDQRAFEANAAAILARSEMDASELGMLVNREA